jgi:ATP phosphoribosyltransferase
MLRVGLAKGRLCESAIESFKKLNLNEVIDVKSRRLVFKDEDNQVEYILLKPSDVVTYVENGVCDLGVVGSDVIMERDEMVYELADLKFGKCKFSIATLKDSTDVMALDVIRVATKYPKVAKRYFNELGKTIEIIPLNGSVELAPIVGLSDCIVDIVETGNTLRANNLEVVEDMFDVSARLICNSISYRFHKPTLVNWVKQLKEA